MTYFEDLSQYSFDRTAASIRASRNVGWLDASHDFPTEEPHSDLLDAVWEYCSILVVPTRGLHSCEFCTSPLNTFVRHDIRRLFGSGEIRVFSSTGDVFAAPNLIYHYILQHHYRPPGEFLRAVESGARPGSDEYREMLGQLSIDWRENSPVLDEPRKIRFVRTEKGIEQEVIKPEEDKTP